LKHQDQQPESDFFIGARLSARRQKLGIQLEKAAKDIRVSVSRLSQIESDDFSSFAHPTYARLFLVDYANYLRVPLEEIRDYLPGSKKLGTSDNRYLEVLLARQTFLHGDQFKSLRRLLFGVGAGLLVLILIGLGIYFWKTWKKLERVQPVAASSAATPIATPRPIASPSAKPRPSITPASIPEPIRTIPEATPTPTPASKASPTPFTLPPFEPSPRPKRPQ
jgi:cytoskeleton protein RodZ